MCVLSELDKTDNYGYLLVKTLSTFRVVRAPFTMLRKLTLEGILDQYEMESADGPTVSIIGLLAKAKNGLIN